MAISRAIAPRTWKGARSFYAAALLCFGLCACSDGVSVPADWQTISDDPFHFSIALPPRCAITRPSDPAAPRRIDAKCDGGEWITLYAYEIKGVVDEQAFSDHVNKAWADGYELVDTAYKPDVSPFLRWLSQQELQGVAKAYTKNGTVRVIATEGRGRFAYSMVMDGPAASKDAFMQIAKSLTVKLPVSEAGYAILFYLGVALLAWLLGVAGFWFRKSRMTFSALQQFVGKPNIDGAKLETAMRSQRTRIMLLPILCIAVYAGGVALIGYLFDPLSLVIFAAVGPFLPVLGYFGIIREPSENDIP